jgi:hypothetical protein
MAELNPTDSDTDSGTAPEPSSPGPAATTRPAATPGPAGTTRTNTTTRSAGKTRTNTRARTSGTPDPAASPDTAATELRLRARIAELEALLEARTQTIVGLGARIAELQGDAPPALVDRVRELEAELATLRATKVLRYSAAPRRWYGRLRGVRG